MKEAVPNYYHKFKCIADKCEHSCCIGWEIDIDEETILFYNSLDTAMGERIRRNIEGEVPHFILDKDERCPFLNKSGLCEIICECGEDALCDICTLHPRFKNFYSAFEETGLGLCCEEAARIILSEEEGFYISIPEGVDISEDERTFFAKRQEIFSLLQNREKSIGERLSEVAKEYGLKFDFELDELCQLYLSLERLDEKWTEELGKLQGFSFEGRIFWDKDFQIPFEQLAVYFVFRHLDGALWDGDYKTRINFVLKGCYLLGALAQDDVSFDRFVDLVRMYSSEVEYSEENLDVLMDY